jgi:hypothetical protein
VTSAGEIVSFRATHHKKSLDHFCSPKHTPSRIDDMLTMG